MKIPQNITIFGDTEFRGVCPTEGAELMTLVSTVLMQKYPGVILIHQKKNWYAHGGRQALISQLGRLMLLPDIVLTGYSNMCCLFIELRQRSYQKHY